MAISNGQRCCGAWIAAIWRDFDFATVSVTIPAVAKNDSYGDAFETTLHVPAPGVLKNDKGVDSVDDWEQTTTHGGFVVMNVDGSFDYTPADGFSGFDVKGHAIDGADGLFARHRVLHAQIVH